MDILKGLFKVFASILIFPCSFFAAFVSVYYCFRLFTDDVSDSVLFNTVGYVVAIILTYQFLKLFIFIYEKIKDYIEDFRTNAKFSKYLAASSLMIVLALLVICPFCLFASDIAGPSQNGNSKDLSVIFAELDSIDEIENSDDVYRYVLNTNTHKFHYPSCSSVKQMSEKNKALFTGTREEVTNMGYDPCGKCKP